MNFSIITKPNTKGQIVIPKKFRDELGIDKDVPLHMSIKGYGLYIAPLDRALSSSDSRNISLEILRKTAGSWSGDNWKETETKRREIELNASKKRKKEW